MLWFLSALATKDLKIHRACEIMFEKDVFMRVRKKSEVPGRMRLEEYAVLDLRHRGLVQLAVGVWNLGIGQV